jgi:hypothetical protein
LTRRVPRRSIPATGDCPPAPPDPGTEARRPRARVVRRVGVHPAHRRVRAHRRPLLRHRRLRLPGHRRHPAGRDVRVRRLLHGRDLRAPGRRRSASPRHEPPDLVVRRGRGGRALRGRARGHRPPHRGPPGQRLPGRGLRRGGRPRRHGHHPRGAGPGRPPARSDLPAGRQPGGDELLPAASSAALSGPARAAGGSER